MNCRRRGAFGAAALILAAGSASADPYFEGYEAPCRLTVTRVLADLGVPPQDIRFLEMQPITQNRATRPLVVGVQGWVGLHSCQGSLVIDMSRTCRVRDVYGKDGCEFDGAGRY